MSSMLCATAAALWVRGRFAGDSYFFRPGAVSDVTPAAPMIGPDQPWRHQYSIHSGAGRVQLVRRELQESSVTRPGWSVGPPAGAVVDPRSLAGTGDVSRSAAGFSYFRRDKQPFNRPPVTGWYWGYVVVGVPCWAVVVSTGVLPGLWVRQWRIRRRKRWREARGLCPGCGYDLRATPGRCPECGRTE